MNRVCSIFSQLLQLFSRVELEAAVRKHKAELHARGFTCWARNASLTVDGLTVDQTGNIFLAGGTHVRKIDAQTGIISSVAGTNTNGYNGDYISAVTAELNLPDDVAVDSLGALYISDNNNLRIRKILSSTIGLGQVKVGSHSAVKAVGIINNGTTPIQIYGVQVSGANGTDFSIANSCGATLASRNTCAINVTFAPSQVGVRRASLVIANGGTPSQPAIDLIGAGTQ